uniref:BPTI/Kunitz inhibitor domain-containing protein n=1 Tax=Elaeophora elaphi TaxID=1147741 RepID=A0A0R3RJG3_9BILA
MTQAEDVFCPMTPALVLVILNVGILIYEYGSASAVIWYRLDSSNLQFMLTVFKDYKKIVFSAFFKHSIWWSGCGGNSNMFHSYAHCMSVCGIYADNHTSVTKMTFRRFIPESNDNQVHHANNFVKNLLNEAVPSNEGRQYHNLFASFSSDSGREHQRNNLLLHKPSRGKKWRPVSVRNNQHQHDQLAKKYQYLFQRNLSKLWKVISSPFKQEPRQENSIRTTACKHGCVSEALDRRRQEKTLTNEARDYEQSNQIQSDQTKHPLSTTSTPPSEYLRAKQIEAYIQQMQTYDRSWAEALREHDRLIQQRRHDEYERMMKYEQELQRYQQAIQIAQNRVAKERADDTGFWHQQQQSSSQGQFLNPGQGETDKISNVPWPTNQRISEEVKRTHLKHRKLSNLEKLKQIEKNRKFLKTTPKVLQLR